MKAKQYYDRCQTEWLNLRSDWFQNTAMLPRPDGREVQAAEDVLQSSPIRIVVYKVGEGRGSNWTVKPEAVVRFFNEKGGHPRDFHQSQEEVEKKILKSAYQGDSLDRLISLKSNQFDLTKLPEAPCIAVKKGNIATLNFLVENGFDLNAASPAMGCPISYAQTKEMAEYLTGQGCLIDGQDKNGGTILHNALTHSIAGQDQLPFIKYLVETLRVNLNTKDDSGCTPLEWGERLIEMDPSCRHRLKEILDFLRHKIQIT